MDLVEKYLGENSKIKVGSKVRVNKGMVGGGLTGKVIELQDNGDIAIVKFGRKPKNMDYDRASYFIDDVTKV